MKFAKARRPANLKDVGSIKRKEIKSIGPFAFICSSSNHKYHTLIFSFIKRKNKSVRKTGKEFCKRSFSSYSQII